MPLETFDPPLDPTPAGSNQVKKARVKMAQFGDGYSQRAQDGLNTIYRTSTWNWGALTKAQFDDIDDFFVARGGYEAFLWTPPGEAVERKWIVQEWQEGYLGGSVRSMTATFTEVFDL